MLVMWSYFRAGRELIAQVEPLNGLGAYLADLGRDLGDELLGGISKGDNAVEAAEVVLNVIEGVLYHQDDAAFQVNIGRKVQLFDVQPDVLEVARHHDRVLALSC